MADDAVLTHYCEVNLDRQSQIHDCVRSRHKCRWENGASVGKVSKILTMTMGNMGQLARSVSGCLDLVHAWPRTLTKHESFAP